MAKIKYEQFMIQGMAKLIIDLSFLGVEGEVQEEDLIRRARDLMRDDRFKQMAADWRSGAWDNQEESGDDDASSDA